MAVTRLNMNIDSDLIARLDAYADQLHINRSAAMSVVLFIILFILTLIQFRLEKKVTY